MIQFIEKDCLTKQTRMTLHKCFGPDSSKFSANYSALLGFSSMLCKHMASYAYAGQDRTYMSPFILQFGRLCYSHWRLTESTSQVSTRTPYIHNLSVRALTSKA